MRALLTVVAFLSAAGTATAAGCPFVTYGFTTFRAVPAASVSAGHVPCLAQTDASGKSSCVCPDGSAKTPGDVCRPGAGQNSAPSYAPATVFVNVPQTREGNGRCAPDWANAQPATGSLSAPRAAPGGAPRLLPPPRPQARPPVRVIHG